MGAPPQSVIRIPVAMALAASLVACTIIPDARPPASYGSPVPPSTATPAARSTASSAAIPAATAALAGVALGPSVSTLAISAEDAASALGSFVESCPRLLARADTSGLSENANWRPACEAAPAWRSSEARSFFTRFFETVRISDGRAFATGYFEPEIEGSRVQRPGYT
ncbi:MAG: hypothetical protein AAFY47_03100, partial [Pseudomonadota bacterium]